MANVFWSNIFRKGDSELQIITQMWQDTPLFKDIPERHTRALCTTMHLRDFRADEMIFTQGEQGAGVILILDGEVRVTADKAELAVLGSGDFFGEIALAAPERRTADARATTRSRLVYFLRQDLEEWLEHEPHLGAKFLLNLSATLARRLLEANNRIARQA